MRREGTLPGAEALGHQHAEETVVVPQQRYAGVGARFHVQHLWLYVAATIVVVLLFAGVIDRLERLVHTGLPLVVAAFARGSVGIDPLVDSRGLQSAPVPASTTTLPSA
jgi:hypothetical protein